MHLNVAGRGNLCPYFSYGGGTAPHRGPGPAARPDADARADRPGGGEAVLAEVAQTFGSQLGVLWLLDPRTGLLRWHSDWSADGGLGVLRRTNARLTFAPGVGLPGRVLETVETAWVEDIAQHSEFPRADAALGAGMRRVIAAPLVSSDGLMGVIKLFGREPRPPFAGEADLVGLAGEQLGAFLGRLAVEDRLRSTREEGA